MKLYCYIIFLLEECISLECRYQLHENCFLTVIYKWRNTRLWCTLKWFHVSAFIFFILTTSNWLESSIPVSSKELSYQVGIVDIAFLEWDAINIISWVISIHVEFNLCILISSAICNVGNWRIPDFPPLISWVIAVKMLNLAILQEFLFSNPE